jgi:pantoate--beta-alanine ligase
MKTIRHPAELRQLAAQTRAAGGTVGFVPTMGALHEGHLSLIRAAREENDLVIVSIFVNPKQFGPSEDFQAYPRDEERDREMAAGAGADVIYAPTAETMYPSGFATTVSVAGITEVLCGAPTSRGHQHFDGVTTVVCKLLNAATPDRAYFGQKDAQQAAVIKRMVRDLDLGVELRIMPIVREADGLAMSSRNAYLNQKQRQQATAISRALRAAEQAFERGEEIAAAVAAARRVLAEADLVPEYLEVRDAETLEEVTSRGERPLLVAVAVPVGPARLIDNFVFTPTPDIPNPTEVPAIQGGSR